MSTIRDVAQLACVSVSTVSRVYSQPDLFREETRRRVHDAARQLQYSPNRNAASLTTGKTGNIGIIVPNLANPLFPEMVKAAQHSAGRRNLAVLLADSDDSAANEEQLLHALAKDVDALLVFSSLLSDPQIMSVGQLRPMVFVNRRVAGYRCVLVDASGGMRLLTQYLTNLGHTSALYLPGPENSWAAMERRDAILEAGERTGLHVDVGAPGAPSFERGSSEADQLVKTPLPSVVICFNDIMALGVTARLLELGVNVPGQVSVVGWGGTRIAGYSTPALTTIAVPLSELGRAAVDQALLAQGDVPAVVPPVVLGVELVARATTGRPPSSR
jgi:DNA-binding LacI/PurR family transcriptional regulator